MKVLNREVFTWTNVENTGLVEEAEIGKNKGIHNTVHFSWKKID